MKILKRIAVIVLSLVLLLLLANYGISYYIAKKLPSILKSEKDFPYNLSYTDLDVDLLSGSLTMKDAFIAPKDSIAAALKNGIFGDIESINIQGLKLWQLYKHNRIIVSSVTVNTPKIILYNDATEDTVQTDVTKPFKQVIQTGSFKITNGNFKMLDQNQQFKIKASNINFDLFKINVDSATVDENVPVRYRDYNFTCDSLFYDAGKYYTITVNSLHSNDTTLAIKNFVMLPKHTRKQFVASLPKELDQFNLKADSINIPKLDWGFLNDTLYVHSPEVALQQVHANVYRSKEPADDTSRKKLYSELLRSIKFDLKIGKLLLKNSLVEYEEQLNFSKPAAKVTFSKFYATVHNIYSPINKDKLPNTAIDVQCLFMQSAPLKVNWSFNSMDTSDAFTITGHLQNLESEKANVVSKPLMNATTSGTLKDIQFTINGNHTNAKGTFAIEYDDLKVDIYKKDGKDKNKIISALGNLVVKGDSNGDLKKVDVAVDRAKDKSVFNFLWKFVMQGLKQTILPKILT